MHTWFDLIVFLIIIAIMFGDSLVPKKFRVRNKPAK